MLNAVSGNLFFGAQTNMEDGEKIDIKEDLFSFVSFNKNQGEKEFFDISDSCSDEIAANNSAMARKVWSVSLNYIALRMMNAKNAVSLAGSALFKSKSVVQNTTSVTSRFNKEINSLINNKSLSQEEKENKLKSIEDKIKAVEQESAAKLDILVMLSDTVFSVYKLIMSMKNENMDSSQIIDFMENLINGMDTTTSDFSNAKNKEEINLELSQNIDNMFGQDSTDKLEKQQKQIEETIKDLTEKLRDGDLNEDEKKKTKLMIDMYTLEFSILDKIVKTLKSFSNDKQEK